MSEFEKLYDRFKITADNCDNLRRLGELAPNFRRHSEHFVIKTVIVENGERRIINKERYNAKLV